VKIALLILAVFLILSLISPASNTNLVRIEVSRADTATHYSWSQLTQQADFPKSYNFQLFASGSQLWAFHSKGVWSSLDGATWQKSKLNNIVNNTAFLHYVQFNGMIYGLGTFSGNIEQHAQTSQISRTLDFKKWEIVARESNLPKRYFYNPVVFQGKIWIFGGQDDAGKYADAWNSPDAVHWTKVAGDLPFGKRAGEHFVDFNGKLVMLDHDAWSSADGITWKQLTPKIAEGDIFGYSVEIFDGRIWLIACNRSGKFRSEVLSSDDGITWNASRAPWSPRGGVATCLFNGQLVMTGGKYGGPGIAGQTEFVYSNDVWALSKD